MNIGPGPLGDANRRSLPFKRRRRTSGSGVTPTGLNSESPSLIQIHNNLRAMMGVGRWNDVPASVCNSSHPSGGRPRGVSKRWCTSCIASAYDTPGFAIRISHQASTKSSQPRSFSTRLCMMGFSHWKCFPGFRRAKYDPCISTYTKPMH